MMLLSCTFFVACGDKYGGLRMSFELTDGTELETVELLIDKNGTVETKDVVVRFHGIEENEVGQILVYSLERRVNVAPIVYNGDTCSTKITANTAGEDKLVVRHLSSGKTHSIDLVVRKKSNDLELKYSNYVVDVSNADSEHMIDMTQLCKLLPDGSTDIVYFGIANTLPSGIELITNGEENRNIGFKIIDKEAAKGKSIKIYPIATMKDYEDDIYDYKIITVHFIDTIDEIDWVVSGDESDWIDSGDLDDYQYGEEGNKEYYGKTRDNPIRLIKNTGDRDLNTYIIDVKELIYNAGNKELVEFDKNFYTLKNVVVGNTNGQFKENIIVSKLDSTKLAVLGTAYTDDIVKVDIVLEPNGVVGEIKSIATSLYVKVDMRADTISVSNRGEEVEFQNGAYSIEVSTYYENQENSLFNFNANTLAGYKIINGMDKLRIEINPTFIKANEQVGAGWTGVIYTDNKFEMLLNSKNVVINGNSIECGSNIYIINILKGDSKSPLRFYFDSVKGCLVSEEFDNASDISLTVNDGGIGFTDAIEFAISTVNDYVKEDNVRGYSYLKNEAVVSRKIIVNKVEGIQEYYIFAQMEKDNEYFAYNSGNSIADDQKVYLNRYKDESITNLLVLNSSSLVGSNGIKILNEYVDVSIQPKNQNITGNLLKIYDGSKEEPVLGSDSVQIKHTSSNSYIGFTYGENTAIGEYEVTFSQPLSGTSHTVTVVIYETFDEDTLPNNYIFLDTHDKLFGYNVDYYDYLGFDGSVESIPNLYIVSSGLEESVTVRLADGLLQSKELGLIGGYTFESSSAKVNGDGSGFIDDDTIEAEDYLKISPRLGEDNVADLYFKQGTYVEGIKFIKLTISVGKYEFEYRDGESGDKDIVKKKANSVPVSYDIYFFIYEEITKDDLSLDVIVNNTNGDIYAYNYLSPFDKDDSIVDFVIGGMNSTLYLFGSDDSKTTWSTSGGRTFTTTTNTTARYTAMQDVNQQMYNDTITATVKQFNKEISISRTITIKTPIVSESLVLTSDDVYVDANGEMYIYMKQGESESYEVKVDNRSSRGSVSNPGIRMMIVNGSYAPVKTGFNINYDDNSIVATTAAAGEYYLIIFARDALKINPTSDMTGYDVPSSFLRDRIGAEDVSLNYKNAYLKLKIYLTDGSVANPYLIQNAEDLMSITGSYNYKVMNNFSLYDGEFDSIDAFAGNIFTESDDVVRKIKGIKLTKDRPNLFTNLTGSIKNIEFGITYDINEYSGASNIGLIDEYRSIKIEEGTDKVGCVQTDSGDYYTALYNVSVIINGTIAVSSTDNVYAGGLVGKNCGYIVYNDTSIIGSETVPFTISGEKLIFGGLVGSNTSKMEKKIDDVVAGVATAAAEDVEFSISIGNQDAIVDINISADSKVGAIGGLIGENTGKIKNGLVAGNIYAEETDNVGGVIGINISGETKVEVTISTFITGLAIDGEYDVTGLVSTVKISANDNVGGIIGYNTNGRIENVHYQIVADLDNLDKTKKTPALKGNNNVGGIIGYTDNGVLKHSSVYSYWWDYNDLDHTFEGCNPDIQGSMYVAGLVGKADSFNLSDPLANGGQYKLFTIMYSSANAYVSASESVDSGIVNRGANKGIVFNANFIGTTSQNRYTAIGTEFYSNYVYMIYGDAEDKSHVISNEYNGVRKYEAWAGSSFVINHDGTYYYWGYSDQPEYWAQANNLNGGHMYITKESDSTTPIFDIAPTEITATVKETYQVSFLEDLLVLNYYDFNSTSIDFTTLNALNEIYNKYDIKSFVNFGYQPSGIGAVRLYVQSSDKSVAEIDSLGKLIIKKVGECTLTFMSVLNPGVQDTITLKVVLPMGDKFNITANPGANFGTSDEIVNIAKGKSKLLYGYTSGSVEYKKPGEISSTKYSYATNLNPNLKVEINVLTTALNGKSIGDYINISGQVMPTEAVGYGTYTKYVMYLDGSVPFSIKVIDSLSEDITITVTPYDKINHGAGSYKVERNVITIDNTIIKIDDESNPKYPTDTFKLKTFAGITGVSFNYTSAVLYPTDITDIIAYITTDIKIEDVDTLKNLLTTRDDNIKVSIEYLETIEYENNIQTVRYSLKIDKDFVFNTDNGRKLATSLDLRFFNDVNYVEEIISFTVLPQAIEKIEIKSYAPEMEVNDEDGDGENHEVTGWTPSDMIKPAKDDRQNGAILQLSLVPNVAYYDYIELRDVTGLNDKDLIKFMQAKEQEGSPFYYTIATTQTLDGLGVRLTLPNDAESIFVFMMVGADSSTKLHQLEVKAFINGQKDPIYTETLYDIEAKMLPSINANYIEPNAKSTEMKDGASYDVYLASGTDAQFNITHLDDTSGLMWEIVDQDTEDEYDLTKYYDLVNERGQIYILKYIGNENDWANLSGKKFTLKLRVEAVEDNGSYEEAIIEVKITLVKYVIHGVSLEPTVGGSVNGLVNRPVGINFYFDTTDISYRGRRSSDSQYRLSDKNTSKYDSDLSSAYDILETLNGETFYNYISASITKNVMENGNEVEKTFSSEYSDHALTITEGENSLLRIKFEANKLTLTVHEAIRAEDVINLSLIRSWDSNNHKWIISSVGPSETANLTESYGINFINPSDDITPQLIFSYDDLKEMSSEGYYALANDITIDSLVPLDVKCKQLDGNGFTITITGISDRLTDKDLRVGLFEEIYDGMIVKNLTVEYNINTNGVLDLNQNASVDFDSTIFGGLASENNGVITNCKVEGEVNIQASAVENKNGSMTIGGMVAVNSATGYITHSTVSLSITAHSNIGGFVYENAGKIASSKKINGKINAYNSNTNNSQDIVVNVAGFVAVNTGSVSMSYISLDKINSMSSPNVSAGFILNNSGSILDCYAIIESVTYQSNSSYFSGFVDTNTGTVEYCYSYINKGNKTNNNIFMFVRMSGDTEENGISNCIEIRNNGTSLVNGVTSVEYANAKNAFIVNNFTFGGDVDKDNNAVWVFEYGLPVLVSTRDTITDVYCNETDDDLYKGLTVYKKIEEETEDGKKIRYETYLTNYGTKNNPFIITSLEDWDRYFGSYAIDNMNNNYFRIVKDIVFNANKNPITSNITLAGNIEGNNMVLSNIQLRSNESLNSIGLFEEIVALDGAVDPVVKNIHLTTTAVWASNTKAVGLLAGVIENYRLYNISVDAVNTTFVGGNVVGGVAGIIRGKFDIERLYSNAGANSGSNSSKYLYSSYLSINNRESKSANIQNIHYSGSIAGVIDGYNEMDNYSIKNEVSLTINRIAGDADIRIQDYYPIRNIRIDGDVILVGDTVGSAFGLIGERTHLEDVVVNVSSGKLGGYQYSAGLVGENRGIVTNANITLPTESIFKDSQGAIAGVVGFNNGGYIELTKLNAGHIETGYSESVVGGIVARNVNGVIKNVEFNGTLLGKYVGGIVGADYSYNIIAEHSSNKGALSNDCKNDKVIASVVRYEGVQALSGLKMTEESWLYLLNNIDSYYTHKAAKGEDDMVIHSFRAKRVLGLCVGLTDKDLIINNLKEDNGIIFNTLDEDNVLDEDNILDIKQIECEIDRQQETIIPYVAPEEAPAEGDSAYVYNFIGYGLEYSNESLDRDVYIAFTVGGKVNSFDSWNRKYYDMSWIDGDDDGLKDSADTFIGNMLIITTKTELLKELENLTPPAES